MLRLFRHYIPVTLLELIAGDVAVALLAVFIASHTSEWLGYGPLWPKTAALAFVLVETLALADLYRGAVPSGKRDLVVRVFLTVSATAVVVAATGFAIPVLGFSRSAFLEVFAVLAPGLVLWRLVWLHLRKGTRARERVLVVGLGPSAEEIVRLQSTGARPFTVLGFLDDRPAAGDYAVPGAELLGKTRDLLSLVDELLPDLVLVVLPEMRGSLPARQLLECRLRGIRVEDWPTFCEKQTGRVLVTNLRPSWLIFSDGFVKTHFTQRVKRTMDLVLSLVGIVLSAPVMILIGLAIKADSHGPVLFRQERVGQNGRIFVLKKFRSMSVDAERHSGAVWAAASDPRVTRVGRFLRRSRLDELPQLFNIVVGEMSFIGPRPERPEFVQMLQERIPFYMERHSVKPGLTGWAQIRHHYAASVEDTLEKLQYDLYYVKNLSPFLDLIILLGTIQVVLFARGAR